MRIDSLMLGAAITVVSGTACGTVEPTYNSEGTWAVDHATSDGALLGVWGSGPTDVWAVGGQVDRSLVLHGDGSRWTPVDVTAGSLLSSVYGFSGADVYAVGQGGLILHYDGSTWSRVESGTTLPLFGLWGASGDDVWIVGGDISGQAGPAVVLRGSHGSFHAVELPSELAPSVLFKAHGFAPDDVMLVGGDGAVLRWNGAQWRRDPVPTNEPLFSTWGRGAADVFAVGGSTDGGEILHFDGQAWSQVAELPTGQRLSGVFTSSDEPTITVGPQLVFELARDGSLRQAALPEMAPGSELHGVWGDQQGTTYAVGGALGSYPDPMNGVILTRR